MKLPRAHPASRRCCGARAGGTVAPQHHRPAHQPAVPWWLRSLMLFRISS